MSDFSATDEFDFRVAIRNESQCGSTPPPIGSLSCNGPKAVLCAWQSLKTPADKLTVEKCIAGTELAPIPACMSDTDSAACRSQLDTCLDQVLKDKTAPLKCYDGDQGLQLVKTAADEWNEAAPVRGYIPCVFVDGHGVKNATHCDIPMLVTYADVKEALCAAGSTSPVCSKVSATLPEVA